MRSASLGAVARHVLHIPVKPRGEPLREVRFILGQLDARDPHGVEAKLPGFCNELAFEDVEVV